MDASGSESYAGLFMPQCFANVTLEVLGEPGSASAWTRKSITSLVKPLRTRDFECLLTLLRGLIEALAAGSKCLFQGPEKDRSLLGRVAKWTGAITTDFFSGGDEEYLDTAAHSRQFYTIIKILAYAYNSGLPLHSLRRQRGYPRPTDSAGLCSHPLPRLAALQHR